MAGNSALSREYLEEALTLAKEFLPRWAFALLRSEARSKAGGRSKARVDKPSTLEALALPEIRPAVLRDLSDEDLRMIWRRLNTWFGQFTRRKQDSSGLVTAGRALITEMQKRGLGIGETALFESSASITSATLEDRLNGLPNELLVVRDFVSLVGSAASDSARANDVDMLVRAPHDADANSLAISAPNVWLPLRNELGNDPPLQFIFDPQGAHEGVNVPLYDLVLRRRDEIRQEITKRFPNETPEAGVHVHNLERENKTTKEDGAHRHLFVLEREGEDPLFFGTEVDGEHTHDLKSTTSNRVARSGEHTHRVVADATLAAALGVAVGTAYETEEDGEHKHELQGWSSAFDGIHAHSLKLLGGLTLRNMMPGEYWTHRGEPDQSGIPTAPDAEALQKGQPDAGDVHSDAPLEVDRSKPAQSKPDGAALGVCDPKSPMYDAARCAELKKHLAKQLHWFGPKDAVAFIAAAPTKIEAARGEALVGPMGITFADTYLKKAGLQRGGIITGFCIPEVLTDSRGEVRPMRSDDAAQWRDYIEQQIAETRPSIIVALGRAAAKALGDKADFTLPHPGALRKWGDHGEVTRKVVKLRKAMRELHKASPRNVDSGNAGTRQRMGSDFWFDHWHDMVPTSGKGTFVYQHHWRGLTEDERGLDDAALLGTGHSLHGDLRMTSEDPSKLWAWTVIVGRTQDNRRVQHGDRFMALTPRDLLRGSHMRNAVEAAPKLPVPIEWLDFGVKKPELIAPGGVGATSLKWAKILAKDRGTYQLGVVTEDSAEILLDGSHLRGRYVIRLAKNDAGKLTWAIEKPTKQAPTIEQREFADLLSEAKAKRQKFLIWAGPGVKPQKIDVPTGRVLKSLQVPITKADEEKQIVYGVVLDPYQFDAHDDWVPPSEIEATAHKWAVESRVIGVQHTKLAKQAVPVETYLMPYPSPEDYRKAMANEPHRAFEMRFGSDFVHSGAWIVGTKLGDKLWAEVKAGKLNAYSIGAMAARTEVSRDVMPKVEFIKVDFDRGMAAKGL